MTAHDYASNTRRRGPGRPFAKGNPGRPHGARNRASVAAEVLLDEAENITRKCVEMALAGDRTALRLCLERIVPPRHEQPVEFSLSEFESPGDVIAAITAIVIKVAAGEILPSQATELARLVETAARVVVAAKQAEKEERTGRLFPSFP
jgi:hypothetical protein